MTITSYRDLDVWQKSMDLIPQIYGLASRLPKTEVYGLVSQIQRASVSIPSNIAEGTKRSSRADFRHFCLLALGSAAELETQLLVINRVYPEIVIDGELDQITNIQMMLNKLSRRLKESPTRTQ